MADRVEAEEKADGEFLHFFTSYGMIKSGRDCETKITFPPGAGKIKTKENKV